MCGVYHWRTRLLVVLFWLGFSPIFIFSKSILISLDQDEDISGYSQTYLRSILPALLISGLIDTDRVFMTSFGKAD